ncbi:spore germination protein [Caldinitratiruptor microaerophilus]|uniref:Uncharacterized protein n=1 Tax=Caldinitratiruptor microaerophilus TaxID=671077 RepID=A0AA35CNK3_9FIRM|nr:spore germination protein [Caldinitratiruptor microaerophilus]BDG60641.1 hypothetical protein caldi_17310 [Caldinitratiruptor microaerophilus]
MTPIFVIFVLKIQSVATGAAVNLGEIVVSSPTNNNKRNAGAGDSFGDNHTLGFRSVTLDPDHNDTLAWQPSNMPVRWLGF